ncbi:MAG: response regulator [Candidatus Eisenbacteria bacterium]|nr:response regulator [Candidatus Eisenbacteria bacterium]
MTSSSVQAASNPTGPLAPARLLVVDDEPAVVEVFEEFLRLQGYQISTASSGEDAVRMIPNLLPDIILTDINLPGLSGLEVMRFAKTVDPEVGVIVVTGHASASNAIEALRQGAFNYIQKPFDLDEIHEVVERALANRRLKAVNRELVEDLRQKHEILQHHEQELRERVRVATWQMTALYDVGKEIMADLELVPRLKLVAARGADLSGAAAAVIYLKGADDGRFHAALAHGVDLAVRESVAPTPLNAQPPLVMPALEHGPVRSRRAPGAPAIELPAVPAGRFNDLMAVPMVSGGECVGALILLDKPGGFSDDDEGFMSLYAAQAANAVRNSQLYEHTKSLDRLKSEFVAVVSHEIRTPLTSVKGAVELLSDDHYFHNNEHQAKLLSIAHANTERLLVLINSILDFSKLEAVALAMNMERQRLEPLIQQAAYNLRTLLDERRIQLSVDLSAELPDLMLDPNRVAQVITNLLSNAIKFSPEGGRIEVTAEPWEGAVRVGVRDYGEGIAAQDMPKLFKRFSQIDSGSTRKVGGTGLGLVISKGIVEQHGGRIWVDSVPAQGSTFYFTLPIAEFVRS